MAFNILNFINLTDIGLIVNNLLHYIGFLAKANGLMELSSYTFHLKLLIIFSLSVIGQID